HSFGFVGFYRASHTFHAEAHVPGLGRLRKAVDVVGERVAVQKFERLVDLYADDAGEKDAAFLVDTHRLCRDCKHSGAQTVFDIDEGVLYSTVVDEYVTRGRISLRMLGRAFCPTAQLRDRLFWHSSLKANDASDHSYRGHIKRRRLLCRLCRLSAATTGGDEHEETDGEAYITTLLFHGDSLPERKPRSRTGRVTSAIYSGEKSVY